MEEGGQDWEGRSSKSLFIADLSLRLVYGMRD